MTYRFLLLPHTGTWMLAGKVDAAMLPEDTILLDPWNPNPARRARIVIHGGWCAMTEADVDRLGLQASDG